MGAESYLMQYLTITESNEEIFNARTNGALAAGYVLADFAVAATFNAEVGACVTTMAALMINHQKPPLELPPNNREPQ